MPPWTTCHHGQYATMVNIPPVSISFTGSCYIHTPGSALILTSHNQYYQKTCYYNAAQYNTVQYSAVQYCIYKLHSHS